MGSYYNVNYMLTLEKGKTMELILIRHGQPDYSEVTERKYIGHGRDLAKLTELGKEQAEKVSRDERLKGAEIILSSPYTRALQTAAIISRNTGIQIEVETDLIEWMPDLTFTYDGPKNFTEIDAEIIRCKESGIRNVSIGGRVSRAWGKGHLM